MKHISSYPSIYALGHRAIKDIFSSPVVIEEKIDGSQFSMCKTDGVLACRSKGVDLIVDAPEKMFFKAVETAQSLDLHDGWTYRCEYLQSAKHNTLAYSRYPMRHLIVFDVMTGPETYLSPADKFAECTRLGLECVPCLYDGPAIFINPSNETEFAVSRGFIENLLHTDSVLGGCKIEGIVIKNYTVFTPDKKVAIAKFVSEAFKESHIKEWRTTNPTQTDVVQLIILGLKNEARWRKAIQHKREAGQLDNSPKDIGLLIKEIPVDILGDSEDEIKQRLFDHFWPTIRRGVVAGFPEFYKEELANQALNP